MTFRRKVVRRVLLSVTGAALLLSFASFAYLFFHYRRGDDGNNEDVLLTHAETARDAGEHPLAAELYRRLSALNPLEPAYREEYRHALVRMRNFSALAIVTNGQDDAAFSLTEDERAVEAAIETGARLSRAGSNELAIAEFSSVTGLNYFAAMPFVIMSHVRGNRPDLALTLGRQYVARFPDANLIQQNAELAALAKRRDVVEECREAALRLRGQTGILLAHYCDALSAWLAGDGERLARQAAILHGEVKSPLARLVALEGAAQGDDAGLVILAFREIEQNELPGSRFMDHARAAVKHFLSRNFPSKITVNDLLRLTNAVYDPKHPDVDVLRLSILAKSSLGILQSDELQRALALFPDDRGLAIIRRRHEGGVRKATP